MRKRKCVLAVVLLLLIGAAVGLWVYLHPVWVSAGILQEKMDLVHFTYEIEAELDEGKLTEKQVELFGTLEKLTGCKQKAMYHLTIKGSVWEDKIHALIYPEGAEEPLVELYLSNDMDVINETIFYNTVRNNLIRQHGLLSLVLPAEEDGVYMTLDQLEQIFDADLSRIRSFSLPFEKMELTQIQYFIALAVMTRENGRQFKLSTEQAQIRLEVPNTGNASAVAIRLDVQEPEEAFSKDAELLSGLGIDLHAEKFHVLKSISATVTAGEGGELVLPTNFVSQGRLDFFSEIYALLERLNNFGEEFL